MYDIYSHANVFYLANNGVRLNVSSNRSSVDAR